VVPRPHHTVSEQEVLQSWAYLLFWFAPFAHDLILHNLELHGLHAAKLVASAEVLPLELSGWMDTAQRNQQHFNHFLSCLQKGGSNVLGALLADAFPALHSLHLNACDMAPFQLAPLLSTAPVNTLRLTGGTQLGDSSHESIQELVNLLSQSSIHRLEVVGSLWGSTGAGKENGDEDGDHHELILPVPPSLSAPPLALLHNLTHVKLKGCGLLHALILLLSQMPSLTHLEMHTGAGSEPVPLNNSLKQLFRSMPHLRSLLLPGAEYHGALPSALLEAKQLEMLQVSKALSLYRNSALHVSVVPVQNSRASMLVQSMYSYSLVSALAEYGLSAPAISPS
jgi:hypothetical protein